MLPSLRELNGKVEGPVSISEDMAFHGMITVGASVKTGVLFHLYGMITGDLTVERGGEAIVHGMVNGTVWNYGHVTIYGAVDEIQNCAPDCETIIDSDAQIKRRQR